MSQHVPLLSWKPSHDSHCPALESSQSLQCLQAPISPPFPLPLLLLHLFISGHWLWPSHSGFLHAPGPCQGPSQPKAFALVASFSRTSASFPSSLDSNPPFQWSPTWPLDLKLWLPSPTLHCPFLCAIIVYSTQYLWIYSITEVPPPPPTKMIYIKKSVEIIFSKNKMLVKCKLGLLKQKFTV